MGKPEDKIPQPTKKNWRDESVPLLSGEPNEGGRGFGEKSSVTEERFQVEWATELSRGIERLRDGGVGAAVLDLNLPGSQNVETFDKLFRAAPSVPILILSEADTEAAARETVQRGAQDYLLKEQADGYRLRRTVRAMM